MYNKIEEQTAFVARDFISLFFIDFSFFSSRSRDGGKMLHEITQKYYTKIVYQFAVVLILNLFIPAKLISKLGNKSTPSSAVFPTKTIANEFWFCFEMHKFCERFQNGNPEIGWVRRNVCSAESDGGSVDGWKIPSQVWNFFAVECFHRDSNMQASLDR